MDQVTAAQQADQLRPFRQFIGLLNQTVGNDQTFSGQDAYSYNLPGQFSAVGPYSTSIEGRPVVTARGGVVIPPGLMLIGIGAALVYFWGK
jgi:hypothetical protein